MATLQVGSWEHLQNERKHLRAQRERCQIEGRFAVEDADLEKAAECERRGRWVEHKQRALDNDDIMIKDMPGVWEGEARRYGSLTQGSAVRDLTREEIVWNQDLIADERNFPP